MRKIHVTGAASSDASDVLIQSGLLKNELETIDISLYTKNLDKLFIVFQCFPPADKSRDVKEYKIMRRKTPTLELYLVLDYDKVMQGTEDELRNHTKEVLLKGCEKFLNPLKGFDWPAFETALRQRLF